LQRRRRRLRHAGRHAQTNWRLDRPGQERRGDPRPASEAGGALRAPSSSEAIAHGPMLIPLRTDRPRIRPAYLTVTLIAVNVLVFLYGETLPPYPLTLQHEGRMVTIDAPRLVMEYGLWGSHPT